MPKLLAFLPCEKVIVEKEYQSPSIITVLQRIIIGQDRSGSSPQNTIAPIQWVIFTAWTREEGDQGQSFRQKGELLMPDGSPSPISIDLLFTMNHQVNFLTLHFHAFPVGQTGVLNLRVWIESSSGQVVTPQYSYPIRVERGPGRGGIPVPR